jgi:hypothetical protein
MLVIGCDYHPSIQHIAWIDTETGECGERQLRHRWGSGEILPRPESKRNQRACGDRSYRALALVRALAGRAKVGAVGRGPGADQSYTCAEAEERSSGCRTHFETDDRKSLSAGVGTRSGESRSAATVVASPLVTRIKSPAIRWTSTPFRAWPF